MYKISTTSLPKVFGNDKGVLMDEIWTPILEHEGYSISTHGRVRNDHTGRIMALYYNQQGNAYVGLYLNGRQSNVGIARLMMQAFLENPFSQYDFNVAPIHIDGDLTNNHLDNLAVRSRSYAIRYQQQFPFTIGPLWIGRIIELNSERVFRDSRAAMLQYGVIEMHIVSSLLHEDKVPMLDLHFRRND